MPNPREQYEVGFYSGDQWIVADSGTLDYCVGVTVGLRVNSDDQDFYKVRAPDGTEITGTCIHNRTLYLGVQGDDRNTTIWPDGEVKHGYLPHIEGLCGSDEMELTFCIDCGTILTLPSAEEILAAAETTRGA